MKDLKYELLTNYGCEYIVPSIRNNDENLRLWYRTWNSTKNFDNMTFDEILNDIIKLTRMYREELISSINNLGLKLENLKHCYPNFELTIPKSKCPISNNCEIAHQMEKFYEFIEILCRAYSSPIVKFKPNDVYQINLITEKFQDDHTLKIVLKILNPREDRLKPINEIVESIINSKKVKP